VVNTGIILLFSFIFISKENTMLRANLKSSKVSVIPNAVDSFSFTPDTTLRPSDESKKINSSKTMK
jgi:hypothetical protein